jgi:hypothetical protein
MFFFIEKYFKVKVAHLNESLIACCGNSMLVLRPFDIEKDLSSVFSIRDGYVEPVRIDI